MLDFDDLQSRYVPEKLMTARGGMQPVKSITSYPPGHHPKGCPIVPDVTAIKCETPAGSRWFGCFSFRINSELRGVIQGINSMDEVRMKWAICRVP